MHRTEEVVTWFDGQVRLRVRAYLTDQLPALDNITSSRCLVFKDDSVLVQRDRTTTHILPGGRREANESPLETVHREVLEETGWIIDDPVLLGFVQYTHLTPRPAEYAYPYPEFVHVVYTANAVQFVPEAQVDDGYEIDSEFCPIAALQAQPLAASARLFLHAAQSRAPRT